MFIKIYYITPIVLLGLLTTFNVYNVEAQTNSTVTTYKDPTTGISLQYPSDWHVASKEYVDSIFGGSGSNSANSLSDKITSNINKPNVMLVPESLSGSSLFVLSEVLPFQTSLENYFKSSKRTLLLDPSTEVSDAVPVSINGLNGLKYNATYNVDPSVTQQQILFIKDSKAYIIASQLGSQLESADQIKESKDLNSMINSFKFVNAIKQY